MKRNTIGALPLAAFAALAVARGVASSGAPDSGGAPSGSVVGPEAPAAPGVADAAPPSATEGKEKVRTAPAVAVEKGILRNFPHKFRFPVPSGWILSEGATADEMAFYAEGCEVCTLRVLISPGNNLPLMETVRAIQDRISESPEARLIGQEAIKVAREDGYTLVKEEPPPHEKEGIRPGPGEASVEQAGADPSLAPGESLRTRYVTFAHLGDKYYILLRAPRNRFARDDAALEQILARFRFGTPLSDLLK